MKIDGADPEISELYRMLFYQARGCVGASSACGTVAGGLRIHLTLFSTEKDSTFILWSYKYTLFSFAVWEFIQHFFEVSFAAVAGTYLKFGALVINALAFLFCSYFGYYHNWMNVWLQFISIRWAMALVFSTYFLCRSLFLSSFFLFSFVRFSTTFVFYSLNPSFCI